MLFFIRKRGSFTSALLKGFVPFILVKNVEPDDDAASIDVLAENSAHSLLNVAHESAGTGPRGALGLLPVHNRTALTELKFNGLHHSGDGAVKLLVLNGRLTVSIAVEDAVDIQVRMEHVLDALTPGPDVNVLSRGYGGVGEAVAELAKFAEAVNHMIRIADMGAVAEGQRIVEGVGLKTATVVDNDDASDSLHATARIMCRIDRSLDKKDVDFTRAGFNRVVDDFGNRVVGVLVPAAELGPEGGGGIEEGSAFQI